MIPFKSLVLLTTNICNLKCRHCYPLSGPTKQDASRYGDNKSMGVEQAERYICQIPDLKNVGKRLHLAGGESTLFTKEFLEIVSLGKKYNLIVSMTTNSSWAKDQKKADDFIEDLKQRGMKNVEISLSVFHQELLSIEYPLRAMRACKKFGLNVFLRPVGTKSGSALQTLKKIPQQDLEGVVVVMTRCIPVGRAKSDIPEEEFLYENIEYGGCFRNLNLAIRQDGSVFPCCAGSDTTRALCLGNAEKEPLSDILAQAQHNLLLVTLLQYGTRYLAEILRENGGKDFLKEKHVNICHLCNDLFRDDKIANDIDQALRKRVQNSVSSFI